jgi:predicted nucleic acid-binding Zn finger protein
MAVAYCDQDGNASLDKCEIHDCLVMCENEWRAENCPNYGMLYCNCPFWVAECPGAWDCEDIKFISEEVIAYYDTTGDASINPEDNIETDHYNILVEYCDFNNDGTIDACEIHACVVLCENEWRQANCPDYGYAYCSCPFYIPECPGAWNCADVIMITDEVMMALDTNGDGQINMGDNLESEHLDLLNENCDTNGNG